MAERLESRDLSENRTEKGLIQIFTGDGKGKTSAALGTVVRAAGHGLRVVVIFFMKGEYPYGERNILARLPGVTVLSFGDEDFIDPGNLKPEQIAIAQQALVVAREAMLSGKYDMMVLDEINVAAAFRLVPVEDVVKLIRDKPLCLELILTGRLADARLIELADLVTEMVKIKHPFDKGIPARRGVEY